MCIRDSQGAMRDLSLTADFHYQEVFMKESSQHFCSQCGHYLDCTCLLYTAPAYSLLSSWFLQCPCKRNIALSRPLLSRSPAWKYPDIRTAPLPLPGQTCRIPICLFLLRSHGFPLQIPSAPLCPCQMCIRDSR